MFNLRKFSFLVGLLLLMDHIKSELFTAMTDMEDLLDTELVIIKSLEEYIKLQEKKIDDLKLKVQEYQKEYSDAKNDSVSYLSNPINAYVLTKRLTSDWKNVEELIIHDAGNKLIENIATNHTEVKFPTIEDFNGAATALIRLQKTYNLNASSVARGDLNGVQYGNQLSASDCYELGRIAYNGNDHYRCALWMTEAMERIELETDRAMVSVTKADILGYLAFSTYKQGDVVLALNFTKQLLDINPNAENAVRNVYFYEKEINETIAEKSKLDTIETVAIKDVHKTMHEKYEMLCRGELQPTPADLRTMRCKYIDNNVPFLKLAPFKAEEISKDPLLILFHDVIYENEIETIKELSKPRLNRASVFGDDAPKIRISKTGWLQHDEHIHISNVVRRSGDMTTLNMKAAESLQICNYGIGGHYETHVDFAEEPDAFEFDRTATVMYYLSDVPQGGATVFPKLGRAVWPKKGSAVFWYNLLQGGEGDQRTYHGGCPVLAGSKWVANLWIHSPGQVCHPQQ